MKVLLISANTEQINMLVLPLGLAYVAAALDDQRHMVKILNLMMQTDTQKALYGTIDDFNPEIIGISVRNIDDQNMENPRFLLNAVKEGLITADDNLLMPKFYMSKGLESWLRQTVKVWMENRTHWVM